MNADLKRIVEVIEDSYYLFAQINAESDLWLDARSKTAGVVATLDENDIFDLVDNSPKLRQHLEDKGVELIFSAGGELRMYGTPGELTCYGYADDAA